MATESIKQSINNNIFLKNILDNSNLVDSDLNNKYWFTESKTSELEDVLTGTQKTSFFIVKKYDDDGYKLNDDGSYVLKYSYIIHNITAGLQNSRYFF